MLSTTARKALISEMRASLGETGLDILDISRMHSSDSFRSLAYELEGNLNEELVSFFGGYEEPHPSQRAGKGGALPDLSEETAIRLIDPQGVAPLHIVVTPKLGTPAIWNQDRDWIPKRVGGLRLELAKKYADKHGLFDKKGTPEDFRFTWVTDFPMYEFNESTNTWDAAHHPFTSPHEADIASGALYNDKGSVRAQAYDIVLNGLELGSGSIRIHQKEVQAEIFRTLGMSDEAKDQAQRPLRLLSRSPRLRHPTPRRHRPRPRSHRHAPHRLDQPARSQSPSPRTAKAVDLMCQAPSPATETQLRDLHRPHRRPHIVSESGVGKIQQSRVEIALSKRAFLRPIPAEQFLDA